MFETIQKNIAQPYLHFNFTALWNKNIGENPHICVKLSSWGFTLKSQPRGSSQKQNSFLDKKILKTHCELWVNNMEKHSFLFSLKSYF